MIPITAGLLGGAGAAGARPARAGMVTLYVLGGPSRCATLGLVGSPLDYGISSSASAFAPTSASCRRPIPTASYKTCIGTTASWAARFSAERPYGAFMMGATSGLVAAPCGAPAFAAVLTFVAATGSAVLGFTYLLAFSLGMTAVLVGVGTFAGAVTSLPRSGAWLLWLKRAGGVLLLAMAEYYVFQAGQNS
jgi:thiol:disulfide interchange protein DsbD